eukprot:TRINITY_DN60888_c0_g1_i1.p1 TRINITY_DN60888_c0_g1~~TRINITY_DN60888_c0_g1_i1.p1  ORF type:complete len:551 (+),score=50.44 TRINITY_DN60888_c0_g1_i1:65-1717(+)
MPVLEGDDLVEDIATRGFCFGQLLQFVHQYELLTSRKTTSEVVRDIIVPESKSLCCPFVDIMPGVPYRGISPGRKTPHVLMSHWWGNLFLGLVRAIAQCVAGKESLSLDSYTDEELQSTWWLCIFGVNQHRSICGTQWNPCDCGADKFLDGDLCEMNKFAEVMRFIPRHALAMDPTLKTLKRIWVQSEVGEALASGKNTHFFGNPSLLLSKAAFVQGSSIVPRVQDAEATYEADKTRILAHVDLHVGFEKFNGVIGETVAKGLRVLCFFNEIHVHQVRRVTGNAYFVGWVLSCNVHGVAAMLKADPTLVAAADPLHDNETALKRVIKCIRPNHCDDDGDDNQRPYIMMKLLLGFNADCNTRDDQGKLPLEFLMDLYKDTQDHWNRLDQEEQVNMEISPKNTELCKNALETLAEMTLDRGPAIVNAWPFDSEIPTPGDPVELASRLLKSPEIPVGVPIRDFFTGLSHLAHLTDVHRLCTRSSDSTDSVYQVHSLENLQNVAWCRTHNIDMAYREKYLAEEDFTKAFGMSRLDMSLLPGWKLTAAKKKIGLY